MHQIFISYASEDRDRAQQVAAALEAQGWTVWWDRQIAVGRSFGDAIEQALRDAKCVVVLWSEAAVQSHWVRDEAAEGKSRGILMPVLLDDASIPLGFRQLQTASLKDWDGSAGHPAFEPVRTSIETLVARPPGPSSAKPARTQPRIDARRATALPPSPPAAASPVRPLLVAAVFLAAGLAVLAAMVWNADFLVRLGLVGNLWYVLLLLVGLAAAVCLFELFKSYAVFRGRAMNGTVAIGGPGVLMLVVVVLGFQLVPAPVARFDQTVFIHGEAGRQARVLRNRGAVLLDLGADRRTEAIGDKGEARFIGIPADQRGTKAPVTLEAEDYELVDGAARVELGTETTYLAVRPKKSRLTGQVLDERGRPLAGAQFSFPAGTATTNADGRFELSVPVNLPEQDRTATITAPGYVPWQGQVVPGGSGLMVRLPRER